MNTLCCKISKWFQRLSNVHFWIPLFVDLGFEYLFSDLLVIIIREKERWKSIRYGSSFKKLYFFSSRFLKAFKLLGFYRLNIPADVVAIAVVLVDVLEVGPG